MSIIHVNQIKTQIEKTFRTLIDLSDVANADAPSKEGFFLTRGLAAYSLRYLADASPEDAAQSITDGGDDNGIDAIYYDEANRRLFLVQSKWIRDGSGEPENGDVKKFVSGVKDLFGMEFDRFNNKVRAKQATIEKALSDPTTKYEIVLVYTGANSLAIHSSRDLDDLEEEMNDVSEVVVCTTLNQGALHSSLTAGVSGEPINLEVGLKAWGKKEHPYEAFYGQVEAVQIYNWWKKYRTRLFAQNLRSMLGETDVNAEMRGTLEKRPQDFWYFNNGVTMIATRAARAMAGGPSTDFSTFHCDNVSVVNGAQTVGTIGKFGDANASSISDVLVPIRIIVRGEDVNFGEEVTRTNNRQNRIESRDFVTQDPEQVRIRAELAIDGIDYQLMRSESTTRTDTSFDLVDATTALACASGTVRLPVQLKREIGKLWDDLTKAPYKELFNPSVPGLHVWRCVQLQRKIDKALDGHRKKLASGRLLSVATHGNRILSSLVFHNFNVSKFRDPGFDFSTITDAQVAHLVDDRLKALSAKMHQFYPGSIVPTLFKNLSKCELLVRESKKESVKP